MRKLTYSEIAEKRQKAIEIHSHDRMPVTVLVDNVRSLYNVGSIFRTSDAALVQNLILTGFTPVPPRKEIEKTALGATESVPWEYVKDPVESIALLRGKGTKTCCLELTDKSIPYTALDYSHFPLCLVIGNEVNGVSHEVISQCDLALEIPMFGVKHSLNVAVAYGIAVFELLRVWRSASSFHSKASV